MLDKFLSIPLAVLAPHLLSFKVTIFSVIGIHSRSNLASKELQGMNGLKRTIAIPLFGDRVSPHFGSSSRFLVVVAEERMILHERMLSLNEPGPMQQARRLVSLGVEEIICGGIRARFKEWLVEQGVVVMDNQKGRVREIMEELFGRKEEDARR